MCVRARVHMCVCALIRACISDLGLRGARPESVYVRLSSLVCVLVRENVLCVWDVRVRLCACVRACLLVWLRACLPAPVLVDACVRVRAGVLVCSIVCELVRSRMRTHAPARASARQFSCARASLLVYMHARLRMCQLVLV
jgi:hypothetical protein